VALRAPLPAELPPAPAALLPAAPPAAGPGKKAPPDVLDQLLLETAGAVAREGLTDPDARVRRTAFEALEAMGGLAVDYVPDLVRALRDRDLFVRWIATRALGKLAVEADPEGPPEGVSPAQGKRVRQALRAARVLAALTARLCEQDLSVRLATMDALGAFGPDGVAAVPALAENVGRGDSEARMAAMRALESIGVGAAPSLTAIAAALGNGDARVRAEAARVLGHFGRAPASRPAAAAALPALRRLITDPDPDVRKAVSEAILDITGAR
jgi:hypothetical protein